MSQPKEVTMALQLWRTPEAPDHNDSSISDRVANDCKALIGPIAPKTVPSSSVQSRGDERAIVLFEQGVVGQGMRPINSFQLVARSNIRRLPLSFIVRTVAGDDILCIASTAIMGPLLGSLPLGRVAIGLKNLMAFMTRFRLRSSEVDILYAVVHAVGLQGFQSQAVVFASLAWLGWIVGPVAPALESLLFSLLRAPASSAVTVAFGVCISILTTLAQLSLGLVAGLPLPTPISGALMSLSTGVLGAIKREIMSLLAFRSLGMIPRIFKVVKQKCVRGMSCLVEGVMAEIEVKKDKQNTTEPEPEVEEAGVVANTMQVVEGVRHKRRHKGPVGVLRFISRSFNVFKRRAMGLPHDERLRIEEVREDLDEWEMVEHNDRAYLLIEITVEEVENRAFKARSSYHFAL